MIAFSEKPAEGSAGFYVGIDIGTTYTKALSLNRDGRIGAVVRDRTPVVTERGALFIDLPSLESIIDGYLLRFRSRGPILGVSITSIGESIVPVRDGNPMANPLMWCDPVTSEIRARVQPELRTIVSREMAGSLSDHTFSLYKILWMREALGIDAPMYWLPLSSYIAYRRTGVPRWDFSHASRTMLLDVAAGAWNDRLLSRFGLENSLGPLDGLGAHLGVDRHGTRYFLGGHDHITGLFGARIILGDTPFVYDSIGSSESVVALGESLPPPPAERNGTIGVAFHRRQYYRLCGLKHHGDLLESISRLCGAREVGEFYAAMNERLMRDRERRGKAVQLVVGGDPVAGGAEAAFSLVETPFGAEPIDLVRSAYLHLGSMSRLLVEEVSHFAPAAAELVVCGTATENDLLMLYKAEILGRPLTILPLRELGSVGAALGAATGALDEDTVGAFVRLQQRTTVAPRGVCGSRLREESRQYVDQYRRMLRREGG